MRRFSPFIFATMPNGGAEIQPVYFRTGVTKIFARFVEIIKGVFLCRIS